MYLEPFVGGANIVSGLLGKRMAADACEDLIMLYVALQRGWKPPTSISEEEYKAAKADKVPSALRAFIGFGCSFSGKWFGGYARDPKSDRNYALNAANSLEKLRPHIQDVEFLCADYKAFNPSGLIIYCDVPYIGTTGYSAVGKFNHGDFWQTAREWSQNNTVLTSSYEAPEDFKCVLEISTKTDMGNNKNEKIPRIERVFEYSF